MLDMAHRAATQGAERLLAPFDLLRAQLYRLAGGWAAPWARDRELRAMVLGVGAVAIAALLALGAPLALLALGPIVLGVPHVLADVRYLWVQPGHHRRRGVWLLVVPPLAIGAVAGQVAWGFVAAALALFAVPAAHWRRALGLALLVPLAVAAFRWTTLSNLLFAQLHNVVAVALWWAMFPRQRRWHLAVVGLFVAVCAALGSGLLDGAIAAAAGMGGGELAGRGLAHHARALAPTCGPDMGARIVALYAFGQSVHYAVWLRLVPEQARSRPSPRPFMASYHALKSELGLPLLALAALAALAVAVWAVVDLWAARDGYLRAAIFHGHLELAAGALWFAGRRSGAA
jgi:hypothetical protein